MSNLEKELDFFNKEHFVSQVVEEETRISVSKNNNLLNEKSFLKSFSNIFKFNFSSFLSTASFIGFISIIFSSLVFTKGNFFLFIFVLLASSISMFSLFAYAQNLTKKESNIKSREDFKPYLEDLDYVINLFEKKHNVKLKLKFNESYSADIEVFLVEEDNEVRMITLYKRTLEDNNPKYWLTRLDWAYEDALKKIEDEKHQKMLSEIKNTDKDLWFSICDRPNHETIKRAYDSLFNKP